MSYSTCVCCRQMVPLYEKYCESCLRKNKSLVQVEDFHNPQHSQPAQLSAEKLEFIKQTALEAKEVLQAQQETITALTEAKEQAEKKYCHLCHSEYSGSPEGHGIGDCVPICVGEECANIPEEGDKCTACKRAEQAEAERDDLRTDRDSWRRTAEKLQVELAAMRERERWIPVSERLPEMDERKVLTFRQGYRTPDENGVDIDTASNQSFWPAIMHGRKWGVTHWRELPAPPED